MDSVNYWKKILLQWIKECNFLEKNFYSLDQTEIEIFFMHFKERFKGDISQYNNLTSFLKDQYPLFELHFDDENTLSSGDHVYVYSLLLHFSCVRCPDPFFQENCQKLDELAQRNITAFLQKLLNDDYLTKETLRHVIASVQVFTPPPNHRFVFNAESPMKTPRKITDISPPTPRSCMLQEKNKKVYALKAQLDTLGYEKSVLETDLKNYLDKIDKLNQELKRSNQEIQDLKNDILSRSKESADCGKRHTGEEQIRRLSKQIAQKEDEISKQRETIEDLTEQKDCLNEKLKNAEKQMKVLQHNMADLAEKVDDLSQELEDTPTLDDSSSTLLNTGQRKKVSGTTSYKRPGPPTPSKNAGRLSFGGIGELNREILKESLDMASCSSSSSKTPAKFKFFSSKLSMRGDERKSYVTNFKKKLLSGGTIQCSSTPRKSKAHIDQRRLLDQIMCTASPGPEFSPDCIVKPAVNLPSSLKKLELNRRVSLNKWRQPKLSYASDSGNSDVNSPQMKNVRYVSSGSKKTTKRYKDRRGSIYLRGSMFARNCRTPTMGIREVFKNKLKVQRNANFNKYRHEGLNEMLVKKASLCPNDWDETCNNNNNDFFLKELDMKNHLIEDGQSYGDDDVNNDETSKHFQQLLSAKESNAPFEISEINSNPSCCNVNNSSSNVHSRIIYGASVILNRKIPNVSTTMVRKSSIYVKGNDGKSVILVTNQTITLKDLAQMWLQMNISAKTFIAFSFTATLIGIVAFVIQFIHR